MCHSLAPCFDFCTVLGCCLDCTAPLQSLLECLPCLQQTLEGRPPCMLSCWTSALVSCCGAVPCSPRPPGPCALYLRTLVHLFRSPPRLRAVLRVHASL
jgi:hypothetical protein